MTLSCIAPRLNYTLKLHLQQALIQRTDNHTALSTDKHQPNQLALHWKLTNLKAQKFSPVET